mmetsp:Transcript_31430/g.91167  ORF Transcript_31430/g.91167 Transcript_31430/m.91167 type:complete len:282 (+) Transcript_31430:663-1508(+)
MRGRNSDAHSWRDMSARSSNESSAGPDEPGALSTQEVNRYTCSAWRRSSKMSLPCRSGSTYTQSDAISRSYGRLLREPDDSSSVLMRKSAGEASCHSKGATSMRPLSFRCELRATLSAMSGSTSGRSVIRTRRAPLSAHTSPHTPVPAPISTTPTPLSKKPSGSLSSIMVARLMPASHTTAPRPTVHAFSQLVSCLMRTDEGPPSCRISASHMGLRVSVKDAVVDMHRLGLRLLGQRGNGSARGFAGCGRCASRGIGCGLRREQQIWWRSCAAYERADRRR